MNPRLLPALFALSLWPGLAAATEAAWSRLRDGGYTLLIATAHAAGGASSATAAAGDCYTGHYLSDRGRQQAQRMGARFAARAVEIDRVLAGEDCAALETARFVFSRNTAEPSPLLSAAGEMDAAALVKEIAAFADSGNEALIMPAAAILRLTGVSPREGEVIIVAPNADATALSIVGRIITD
jgi:hypothetical protein